MVEESRGIGGAPGNACRDGAGMRLRLSLSGPEGVDLEDLLVEALSREFSRRYGGNSVLNRLEASGVAHRLIDGSTLPPGSPPDIATVAEGGTHAVETTEGGWP